MNSEINVHVMLWKTFQTIYVIALGQLREVVNVS